MESCKIICRLCFKICEMNFKVMKDAVKKMINFLQLHLNFDVSNEPVICNNCSENLRECFNFKTNHMHKNSDTSIEGEDIKMCPRKNVVNAPECCSCMELINRETAVLLINEDETMMTMLEKYFPELVTNGIMTSMCITCYKFLQHLLAFISNCLIIEERIKEYCKIEGTDSKGQVQLSSVLHFVSKIQMHSTVHSGLGEVKAEESCEEAKNENETEVKTEELIDIEEPEMYCIKKEDIEIKVEQDNSDRSDTFQSMHKNCRVSSPELYQPTAKRTVKVTISKDTKPKSSLLHHILTRKSTPKSTPKVVRNNLSDPPQVKRYNCEKCTYQSRRRGDLSRHMLTHEAPSGIKMFSCEACTYQSKRKDDLLKHTLIHKPASDVTLYNCEMCPYQSKRKRNLSSHLLTHKDPSQVVTYTCKMCTYQSKRKYLFSLHVLTHKHPPEVTMYKCDVCTHQTRLKGNLSKHMLTHKDPSEVIMYKCELCAYQCKRKDRLPTHMLTHKSLSEVTVYQCEICSFQSRYKHYISKHMLTHKDQSNPDASEDANAKYACTNLRKKMIFQDTC